MRNQYSSAVIFDVDGPLLELTVEEEDTFFVPFEETWGLTGLSRDWDSYRVRNDEDIYAEIFERHARRRPSGEELSALTTRYLDELETRITDGRATVTQIPGALDLLCALDELETVALGTATANFLHAARVRLERAGMWSFLQHYPGAADGGGAKREVLARVIRDLGLPPDRIVFLGDNLNDLDAGRANGVHFIGFHVEAARREHLRAAGAEITCGDHRETLELIKDMLSLQGSETKLR